MSALFEQIAAVARVNHTLAAASEAMELAKKRIEDLEAGLRRMVCAHENLSADTEGRYPEPDVGCVECTVGTVPNNRNTGLCAYHGAKKLLGQP